MSLVYPVSSYVRLSTLQRVLTSCKVATVANIGQMAFVNFVVDGVNCVQGDRVLVKNQTDPIQNGIYVVDPGFWPRAYDFAANSVLLNGLQVFVRHGGTTNGDKNFGISTTTPGGETFIAGIDLLTFAVA